MSIANKIVWNKVTRLSQLVAIVLFVGVFFIGFLFGGKFEDHFILGEKVNKVTFTCKDGTEFKAEFYKHFVRLDFSPFKTVYLPQSISASGARYTNDDESFVFWNKSNTSFIQQDGKTVLSDCSTPN